MKTAEEVAAELSICPCEHEDCAEKCAYEKELAQALTAYAEERAVEIANETISEACKEARAEALEEVSKVCDVLANKKRKCSLKFTGHDDRSCPVCADMEDAYFVVADKIRALKDKP